MEGYSQLAAAILIVAIKDYKYLMERSNTAYTKGQKKILNRAKGELERFFNSDYCTLLLFDFGITGSQVLKELKKQK